MDEKNIKEFKFTCEKCGHENTINCVEYGDTHIKIHSAPCKECGYTNEFSKMPTEKELEKTSSFSNSDKGD